MGDALEILDHFEEVDVVLAVAFLKDGPSQWFPTERVVLVDRRLSPRQRWAAMVGQLTANLTADELARLDVSLTALPRSA